MTTTEELRGQIPQEEFDYQILTYSLRNLARPRDKVSALLKSGSIIRVKKGLYIFGPALSRGPYSRELLSNLIYGPSYISLEYALSYYGLIPERAETGEDWCHIFRACCPNRFSGARIRFDLAKRKALRSLKRISAVTG